MRKKNSSREQQRVKTLKEKYPEEVRREWSSKAGKASPSKFTSDSAKRANEVRWAATRAAKAEKEKQANKEV
jgi:hypothetical protein